MPILFQNPSKAIALRLRQGGAGGDSLRQRVDRIFEQDGVAIVSFAGKEDR